METQSNNKSHLTFLVGTEVFAANVSVVTNILEMTTITALPQTPEYLKGVINLRGMVLPVVDMKQKLGMGPTEVTTNTCILVLELYMDNELINVGAIVDAVHEVLEIEHDQIQPPPTITYGHSDKFITGMVEHENKFVMITDMNKVFVENEAEILKKVPTDKAVEKV